MPDKKIPFSPPDISQEEIDEVVDTLRSGWITTGPKTEQFEAELAKACGTRHAVCMNSATAALEMTLRQLGVKEGDEVIVPAYTYTATASVVCHVGAKPVMIDCRADSYEMDYDAAEAAINPRTKAIIAVDIGGVICDYGRLYQAAEAKKALFTPSSSLQETLGRVAVMADAAHSFGGSVEGVPCGSLADFTCFSFHAVKSLTTAEGGAVVWREHPGMDGDALYRALTLSILHGQSKDALAKLQPGAWRYDIVSPAYKCNMPDIMAALGLAQLRRYPQMLTERRALIGVYERELAGMGLGFLEHLNPQKPTSAHLFMVQTGRNEAERDALIQAMADRGIATNVHFQPLPLLTAYKSLGYHMADYPNAFGRYEQEITLPLYSMLSEQDAVYVAAAFRELLK